MSAETKWTVTVLVATEDTIEVSAVTAEEAMQEAEQRAGVIRATKARHNASGTDFARYDHRLYPAGEATWVA